MSEIAALEAEVKEFKLQLETVQSSLQVDPDNTELQSLKTELEELINLTETSIAELKPPAPPAAPQPAAAKDRGAKDSYGTPSNYRKPTAEQPDEPAPSYQSSFSVNENVLARWVSGDNSFYPARITSITGSSSNPVYLVSFKSYGTVESLTSKDIRPISSNDSRKRKADAGSGNSSSQSPAPQPSHSSVISAAADINPALANQARQEPTKVSEGSARPTKAARKVKANKELEAGKMKWKDFASKGKLGRKKDSMFRTGDGLNARVGFTGSGQQMRKDPTRSRHVYQQGEEEGY
ncbi:hypothetical protein BO86DRAFT_390677 [Aspergillus japonicus CBS 114.51]|uniref:Tudor domain-containing protein n=2 Tax=Aspergillus TaxID=5052 RepID=A0A2V5HZA8_ASPV1|nr:hypothetical protein BO86DRAFT_390677 [Aspergillus japonicus CBS 114.51]PYI17187.1 hypothetical protein BO99DRAFT_197484 [Aspergillus violaceofuscus CBS 115571]RAH79904.1 hypothetical protein BO86DRAFT_390677 [Aspergillus japonicus CBS 114.51]